MLSLLLSVGCFGKARLFRWFTIEMGDKLSQQARRERVGRRGRRKRKKGREGRSEADEREGKTGRKGDGEVR